MAFSIHSAQAQAGAPHRSAPRRMGSSFENSSNEERLYAALRAGRSVSFDWDWASDVVVRSPNALEIFGCETTRDTGAAFFNRVHPEDREQLAGCWRALTLEQPHYRATFRVVRKTDGRELFIEDSGQAEFDSSGKVIRLRGLSRDVTDEKQATKGLQKSEARVLAMRAERAGVWDWNRVLNGPPGDAIGMIQGGFLAPRDFVERKQAERALQRSMDRSELLSRTVSKLLTAPDLQDVIEQLCNEVRVFLNCAVFFNFLVDAERGRLRLNACGGVDPHLARKAEDLELGASLCGTAARDGCRVLAENLSSSEDPRSRLVQSLGVQVYACHPLLGAEGVAVGTLSFGATDRERFEADELELMKTVTDHVAVAMARQKVNAALQEAGERYERQARMFDGVASTTPDFVYVFDLAGRFLYANRRLLEVWGIPLEEAVGKTCLELGYEQWHHEMHMREIAQIIRTKQPIKGEVPFKAPRTGIFGIYEYIFSPVLTRTGEVEGIAGTTRDVTERKGFQVELERVVSERTAKLQEMVGELEHFSYSITHDMRAPLRAMRGFAEIISDEDEMLPEEDRHKFINRIITAAERMDGLIADALSYSRAVRQELLLAPVDVGRLLGGMLETYPEFQHADVEIVVERDLPLVLGNEAGLTQCFSNLIGNAVKFSRPEEKSRIRVRAERRGEWVRLWVEDNGIGISESMLPRVFDMFSRGSSAHAGTGIGLALARKVVERMGGKIGVESELGKGSRFWVELKAGDPREAGATGSRAGKTLDAGT